MHDGYRPDTLGGGFGGQYVANHRAGENQWWSIAIISDPIPTAASDLRLPTNPSVPAEL